MNIHYFSESTLISDSANSVHVMKMSDALSANGHDVTLHGRLGEGTDEGVRAYYHTQHDFTIQRHDESKGGVHGLLLFLKKRLPFFRIGGLPSLFFARRVLRKALPQNVDLIFSRNLYWLLGAPKAIPFIFETHSPPDSAARRFLEGQLYKRPSCRGVVVISDKMREIYEELFPAIKDKLIVAHDGADDPAPAPRPPERFKKIGYVGQLYQGRGIDVILEVARGLPDLEFHIVGGRPETVAAFSKVAPGNVVFHGHRPHSQLRGFFEEFDCVLSPYQKKVAVYGDKGDTAAFMSPLKIFEYMSWGLPIICSDLPVLREVLEHEGNALLVEADKPRAWIDALERLRDDEALREALSQKARADFLAHYSWTQRAESILEQAGAGKTGA